MLNQQTLEQLKSKLLKEKKELEEKLDKMAMKSDGDYEATFEDFGRNQEDNAEEVEEYTAKMGVTETLEKKLEETKAALERMEKGTYGICDNCKGEEIPMERLMAYPSASTCLKCSGTEK